MDRQEFIINELTTRNYKVGVEIGSFKGEFASHILHNWNGTLYLIDAWRKLDGDTYVDASNKAIEDGIWLDAMKAIAGFEDRAFMLRMLSNQASKLFADDSLDFVYIDANHRYDFVKEDIELWWPKIKSGGMLSGHDYMHELDWTPSPDDVGKDKHIYMWNNADKESTMNYAGLFGVYPAVNEFANEKKYEVFHTDEWLSSWYLFKR